MGHEVVGQPLSRKHKAASILVAVLIAALFVCMFVLVSEYSFQSAGYNRPPLQFSKMEPTPIDGRTTYLVRVGLVTPNDRVTFSVVSPVIVVRVEVLGSDGRPLYDAQENNGSLSGDIRLFHSSDVTLRITDLCSSCKHESWEYVGYTEYSLSPYFEVLVFSVGSWVAAVIFAVGNYLVATGRLRVRRGWLLLVAAPVGLAFYAFYLWAFDANYALPAGGAFAASFAVPGLLLALERRGQRAAESSGSVAEAVDLIAIEEEGERNRRKDMVEKMLENLYSPLYEILRRARYETDKFKLMVIAEWNKEGRGGPRDCVLSEEQLARVREVVERFGHYMDPVEQALLTKVLANPNSIGAISGERLTQPWHLFLNAEIDPRFDYIKKTRDTLRKELDELIRVSR